MYISEIKIKHKPPIQNIEVSELSNRVVFAGPNGIGKTRLIQSILIQFQNNRIDPNITLKIKSTNQDEIDKWGKEILVTSDQGDLNILMTHIQKRRKRGNWKSSIINFDSDRSFDPISAVTPSWEYADPSEETIDWNLLLNPFKNRFRDTIHALYRKIGHHRSEISKRYEDLRIKGHKSMPIDQTDPIKKYKEMFDLLLSPKVLDDIPVSNPKINYKNNDQLLPIDSLSSGEQEVFRIVFDLLMHEPSDCIIFFDEPELHLHPELSFRLLRALENVGERNQFIFCTHSPDIITESLDHSVIFIKPPINEENQAIVVNRNDDKSVALNLLGQNLGIIAMGRKIVLIEGSDASIDKQIYGSIIGNVYPQYVLLPVGPKNTILSFSEIINQVLSKSLWGIDFYMITDHDSSLSEEFRNKLITKSSGRLAFLPRYHIENYFLDEKIISTILKPMVSEDSWQNDQEKIKEELKKIALNLIPYTVQLWFGAHIRTKVKEIKISVKGVEGFNLDEYLNEIKNLVSVNKERLNSILIIDDIKKEVTEKWNNLENLINTDNEKWKYQIPGRRICDEFSKLIGIDKGKFKTMYINEVKNIKSDTFEEIVNIFDGFNSVSI